MCVCVCVIRIIYIYAWLGSLIPRAFGRIPNNIYTCIYIYIICIIFYVYNFVRSSGNRIFIRLSVAVVVGCVYTRLRRRRWFNAERDTACYFRRREPYGQRERERPILNPNCVYTQPVVVLGPIIILSPSVRWRRRCTTCSSRSVRRFCNPILHRRALGCK